MNSGAHSRKLLLLPSLLFWSLALVCAGAQAPRQNLIADTSWMRGFGSPDRPAPSGNAGRENLLVNDRRFIPLLQRSFPQTQSFWYEHSRLVSTASLARTFLAVPGDAILDQGRYVTVDGCVPHDCIANRGMLWIDTGASPAMLIFAGTNPVNGSSDKTPTHLWLFSSKKMNWSQLPEPFLFSIQRWISTLAMNGHQGTTGYSFNFVMATIIQPNGRSEDIEPSVLRLGLSKNGAGL